METHDASAHHTTRVFFIRRQRRTPAPARPAAAQPALFPLVFPVPPGGTAAPVHTCISSAEFFHSPSFKQCSVSTPCPLLTLRIAAVDIFVIPTASACVFPSA